MDIGHFYFRLFGLKKPYDHIIYVFTNIAQYDMYNLQT